MGTTKFRVGVESRSWGGTPLPSLEANYCIIGPSAGPGGAPSLLQSQVATIRLSVASSLKLASQPNHQTTGSRQQLH